MTREHEAAKAAAEAEVRRHGHKLSLTRRQELRDAIWDTADDAERAAIRAEYALNGWRLCPHSDCPPDHCRAS